MRKAAAWLLIATMMMLLNTGCRSTRREDPILRLSSEEALEQGKTWMAEEKYAKARRFLEHAFEAAPNSKTGREALLLVADAHYLQGGNENYVRCEAKYRDFLNRFPTSDKADYAQFQVGSCLAQRMERPDRDQRVTQQALEAYLELLRLYPSSEYADRGAEEIARVTDNLAEHWFLVGYFYIRYRHCRAAINRLEPMPELYPTYSRMDKAMYYLGVAYRRCDRPEDATATFERLQQTYPQSSYIEKIGELKLLKEGS